MRTPPTVFACPSPFVLPEHWAELRSLSTSPYGDYEGQLVALDAVASRGTAVVGAVTPDALRAYAEERGAEPCSVLIDFLEEVAPLAIHRPTCGDLTAVQLRTQLALATQRATRRPAHMDAAEAQVAGVLDDLTCFAVHGPAAIEVRFDADMPSASVLLDLGRGRAEGAMGAAADALHSLAFYAGVVGGAIQATRVTGEVWERDMTLVGAVRV